MKLYSLYISKRERKLYILREMEWDLTEKMGMSKILEEITQNKNENAEG